MQVGFATLLEIRNFKIQLTYEKQLFSSVLTIPGMHHLHQVLHPMNINYTILNINNYQSETLQAITLPTLP